MVSEHQTKKCLLPWSMGSGGVGGSGTSHEEVLVAWTITKWGIGGLRAAQEEVVPF